MLRIIDPSKTWPGSANLCALGIMTKAPRPGQVKTRLVPPLTPDEAAELNTFFLRDLAGSISAACHASPAAGIGIYTPAGAESVYENILPKDFMLLVQRGNGFQDRLVLAAEDVFRAGFASVCLINSDSPTVPASNFAQAANELAKPGDRVVIGPSADGGYYLIGIKQLHQRLFEDIDWSTERVLEQTRQRGSELGLEVHELPLGLDVDDRASLGQLCDELFERNPDPSVAVNTRAFLWNIIQHEGRDRIWAEK